MTTELAQTFESSANFAPRGPYRLLPARMTRLDGSRYVLTNDVGEHVVLERDELEDYVRHRLRPGSAIYGALKARHFLFDDESRVAIDLLALKLRTRVDRLADLTALHMFVVTLRCDHTCAYCQVSRQTEDRASFDMDPRHADLAVDMVFRSPAPMLKIEFQGGEPLLNFEVIRRVVLRAEEANREHHRDLAFVIASNLTHITDEILSFCAEHDVTFSTSLDGPEALHNERRALPRGNSYEAATEGIRRIREALGPHHVAAVMTTSPGSLTQVKAIIDEYVRHGFHSIFLRSLSPYGFAVKTSLVHRYSVDDWVHFYIQGLDHILELNYRGYPMREEYAAVLLQKVLGLGGSGYIDLQSPAGLGIAGIVYNYDGGIYASDEGRMLAEMGDRTFRLGHLDQDTFESVMTNPSLIAMLDETMLEGVPMCSDCAFLPYCGADPVFHRATQGDLVGHKAFSAFCRKQMAVLRHLIARMEDDPSARAVLESWV
jgi:His-Xaa-Ser system radical SAM maturase HxsB